MPLPTHTHAYTHTHTRTHAHTHTHTRNPLLWLQVNIELSTPDLIGEGVTLEVRDDPGKLDDRPTCEASTVSGKNHNYITLPLALVCFLTQCFGLLTQSLTHVLPPLIVHLGLLHLGPRHNVRIL